VLLNYWNRVAILHTNCTVKFCTFGSQFICVFYCESQNKHFQLTCTAWISLFVMYKDCVFCGLETDFVYLIYMNVNIYRPCHDSGAGLSPRRSGFCPGLVRVEFLVDRVAKLQGFLRIFRFFRQCAKVIFTLFYSYRKDTRAKPIKLQTWQRFFRQEIWNIGDYWRENYVQIVTLQRIKLPFDPSVFIIRQILS